MLPPELDPLHAASPQAPPKEPLAVGGVVAEQPGAVFQFPRRHITVLERAPLTPALSLWERG